MPNNNHWREEANNFLYKQQDFQNSCFSACLQMALVNFEIIEGIAVDSPGRPIEEIFNTFCLLKYNTNIDLEAPTIPMIDNFMLHSFYGGRQRINVEIINPISMFNIGPISLQIEDYQNIAIIGAIEAGGAHATMIIKKEGELFAVDPQPNNGGNYFAQINMDDIRFIDRPGEENLRTISYDNYIYAGFQEFSYIITLR